MFKVAGVSTRNGVTKVRFANDMTRVKVLVKTGSTDINLVELPEAMDKSAAVVYLKTTEMYNDQRFREAIDEADAKYNGAAKPVKPAKATKPVKPAKPVKATPSLDAIRARAAAPAAGEASKEVSVKEAA